jgi:hypothetical protein
MSKVNKEALGMTTVLIGFNLSMALAVCAALVFAGVL